MLYIYSLCKLFPIQLFWLEKHAVGRKVGRDGGEGGLGLKAGSEVQGLVLLGAPLVRHHADQRLHGTAQIVSHVKQTADAGTWGEKEHSEDFSWTPHAQELYLHDMKNVIFVLWFSFFLWTFHIFMKQWGLKMLKTFKALLRPAAYQSYSQYHNVNTILCIIQQRRERSRVVWLNGSWQKYVFVFVHSTFWHFLAWPCSITSKFCTQIS